VNIQLNIITCPTYPETFIRHVMLHRLHYFMLIEIATLPCLRCIKWGNIYTSWHCFKIAIVVLMLFVIFYVLKSDA